MFECNSVILGWSHLCGAVICSCRNARVLCPRSGWKSNPHSGVCGKLFAVLIRQNVSESSRGVCSGSIAEDADVGLCSVGGCELAGVIRVKLVVSTILGVSVTRSLESRSRNRSSVSMTTVS